MIVLRYGTVSLPVLDNYSITKSSQEVKFSDLTCDFTNKTKEQLPVKYQEANVVNDVTSEMLFTGYVDSYDFGNMREVDVDREINITLLSPMSIATLRNATAIGNYMLKDLIQTTILASMIDDGFTIVEMNIADREISVNFLMETVEHCMNILSNKYNFWWYIDENKNIYIRDIDYMFNLKPKVTYDRDNRPRGLEYIKPKISATDYYNVINFKNVRVYSYSILSWTDDGSKLIKEYNPIINSNVNLKSGDELYFNFPIDIKKENIVKSYESNSQSTVLPATGLNISGFYSDGGYFDVYIEVNMNDGSYTMSDNLGVLGSSDESDKEFLMIKDSFYSNLVTGIKYNGTKEISRLAYIYTDSALIWNVVRFFHDSEIQAKKGVVNKSGIIEKMIDMNEQWKTLNELQDIAVASINNNISNDCEIQVQTDNLNDLRIGDIFRIDIDDFLLDGNYAVTSIQQQIKRNDEEYIITLKNANLLDSYIDIFRASEEQQNEDKVYNTSLINYNEETYREVHEVV